MGRKAKLAKDKRRPVSASLSADTMEILDKLARRMQTSRSAVIEEAIRRIWNEQKQTLA